MAACFVEPIQGEGGVHEIAPEYLGLLRAAADRHGFPLVFDEIQSGMGRTGAFFASEHGGVAGDYYLLSKSLGAGLAKISAVLIARERYIDDFGYLHTSTTADDDFSSELALTALDLIEEEDGALMRRCAATGKLFLSRLRDVMARYPDQIRAVRGRGLMIGVELADQRDSPSALIRLLGSQELLGFMVSGWFLREHAIRVAPTLSARATVRLEPSADIERADIERFCAALEELALLLRAGDAYRLVRFVVGRAGETVVPAAASRGGERSRRRSAARRGSAFSPTSWPPAICWTGTRTCPRSARLTASASWPAPAASSSRSWPRTRRCARRWAAGCTPPSSACPSPRPRSSRRCAMAAGRWARDLIDQGIELARRSGCAIVGFGGFTSILTAQLPHRRRVRHRADHRQLADRGGGARGGPAGRAATRAAAPRARRRRRHRQHRPRAGRGGGRLGRRDRAGRAARRRAPPARCGRGDPVRQRGAGAHRHRSRTRSSSATSS